MFKRISIFLMVLLTILCFVGGASATDPGLFVEKDADNTYIDYVDADGVSIMTIDDTDGVTVAVLTAGATTTVTSYTSMTVTGTTDASSLTTGSVTTAGGMSVAKQLYLGDDLDMSVSATGTYDFTLKDSVNDALSIVGGTTDMMVFDTSTDAILIVPPLTVTGAIINDSTTDASSATTGAIQTDGGIGIVKALWVGTTSRLVGNVQIDGTVTISADAGGTDVKIFGNTTLYYTLFDANADTNGVWYIGGGDQKGLDMIWYGATASSYLKWDRSVDDLLFAGAGAVFSGTQAEGIIFGGTITNEVIKIGGTYDHGIFFTEDMVATDVTNSFINIGDYTTGIAVVPSGANMFGVMHNVTMAVNVAYWYQAYYTKITTSGTTTNTSIAGHAYRMQVASSLAAVYGIQCHTNISAGADVTQEVVSISAYVSLGTGDTTSDRVVALQAMIAGSGTAGTVTGDAIVGYFVNAGTVVTTDDIIKVYNQSAATVVDGIEIENDGTMTVALKINNDGSCGTGILLEGSLTNGIDLGDNNTTALNIGSCTTGIDFDGTITTAIEIGACTTGIDVDANTVIPQLITIGTITNPMHWDGVASNVLVYQENTDVTPGSITANKFSLSAAQSAATTSGRLECFRAEVKTYSTGDVTADLRALVGQVEFSGDMTYIGGSSYDFSGAYGVIASIWSASDVTADGGNLGKMYPLGIFFGLETGTSLSGEDAYIYIYNYGKVCPNSVMKLYNASTPAEPTYLFDKAHSTLGSASGPFYTQDVNPHSAPADASLGADGHIKILIGATPYYIPIFANLE